VHKFQGLFCFKEGLTTEIWEYVSRHKYGLIFLVFGTIFKEDYRHKLRDKYYVFVY
jgi:hypothetical protein